MPNERFPKSDRQRTSADGPPNGDDHLDAERAEVDHLLRTTDRVFDSINSIHAQTYLTQNLQTGGQ